MAFARRDVEMRRHIVALQRAVHLERLRHRHADVALAREEQRRRLHVRDVLHRRIVPEQRRSARPSATACRRTTCAGTTRCRFAPTTKSSWRRRPPTDAALNRSVIVISLLTSVPPALHPIIDQPIRIGDAASAPGDRRRRMTSEVHVVEVAVDDVAEEGVAVAGAAAIVRPQHRVAFRGEHRDIVEHQAGAGAELVGLHRPAVHLHDERIASARARSRSDRTARPRSSRRRRLSTRPFPGAAARTSRSSASNMAVTRVGAAAPAQRQRPHVAEPRRLVELEDDAVGAAARRSSPAECSARRRSTAARAARRRSIRKNSLCTPMFADGENRACRRAPRPRRSNV